MSAQTNPPGRKRSRRRPVTVRDGDVFHCLVKQAKGDDPPTVDYSPSRFAAYLRDLEVTKGVVRPEVLRRALLRLQEDEFIEVPDVRGAQRQYGQDQSYVVRINPYIVVDVGGGRLHYHGRGVVLATSPAWGTQLDGLTPEQRQMVDLEHDMLGHVGGLPPDDGN